MKIHNRALFNAGALLGLSVVALGAFGAHALKSILSDYSLSIWKTGVEYMMFHTPVFLVLSVRQLTKIQKVAVLVLLAGVIVFSGSLWVLSLSNLKVFAVITPVGGLLMLVGWLGLIRWFK